MSQKELNGCQEGSDLESLVLDTSLAAVGLEYQMEIEVSDLDFGRRGQGEEARSYAELFANLNPTQGNGNRRSRPLLCRQIQVKLKDQLFSLHSIQQLCSTIVQRSSVVEKEAELPHVRTPTTQMTLGNNSNITDNFDRLDTLRLSKYTLLKIHAPLSAVGDSIRLPLLNGSSSITVYGILSPDCLQVHIGRPTTWLTAPNREGCETKQ